MNRTIRRLIAIIIAQTLCAGILTGCGKEAPEEHAAAAPEEYEEYEEYYCMMELDEDEVYRILTSRQNRCPYYRQGDDYTLARRQ